MQKFNPFKAIYQYYQNLQTKYNAKVKARIREDFILAYWDELIEIAQRIQKYDMNNTEDKIRAYSSAITLQQLDLLLSEYEVQDYRAVIELRDL